MEQAQDYQVKACLGPLFVEKLDEKILEIEKLCLLRVSAA